MINISFCDSDFDVLLEALDVYLINTKFHEFTRFDYFTVNKVYMSMIGFKTRGLRNNNPFNIKKSHFKWVGKKFESSDPVFEQFDNMYYGLRAGMKLLVNYVNKGFNTPRKIIERFAPSVQNRSQRYLEYVCHLRLPNLNPDEPITSLHVLCCLASAMVRYENGINENTLCNIKADASSLFDLCIFYKFKLKK